MSKIMLPPAKQHNSLELSFLHKMSSAPHTQVCFGHRPNIIDLQYINQRGLSYHSRVYSKHGTRFSPSARPRHLRLSHCGCVGLRCTLMSQDTHLRRSAGQAPRLAAWRSEERAPVAHHGIQHITLCCSSIVQGREQRNILECWPALAQIGPDLVELAEP